MKLTISAQASNKLNLAPANKIEEITQNIQNIFSQRKNQIPYQRGMGFDSAVIDERIEVVMMYFQTEMSRQVKKYEPRAKVKKYAWSDSDFINGNLAVDVQIDIDEVYL